MANKLIPGRIAIGGSRSISQAQADLVRSQTLALIDAGYSIRVGCAVGTDAAVIDAIPIGMAGCCHVFAVCGPVSPPWPAPQGRYTAPGAWSGTALPSLARHSQAGGPVTWFAGGQPSVQLVPRLAARTRAMVKGATAGCLVFFSSPGSKGSALCARSAAARGLPVFAVPMGFPGFSLPSLGNGSWSRFTVESPLAGSFLWQPWAHSRR